MKPSFLHIKPSITNGWDWFCVVSFKFINQKIQYEARFEQILIDNEFNLRAEINGQELLNIHNPDPKTYENMQFLVERNDDASGPIRNIHISGRLLFL